MNNTFHDIADIKPTGRLIYDVYRRGQLVEHCDEKNLIVDNYRSLHAHLLGGDVTGRSVTQIGVGTNGTPPVGGNSALASQFAKDLDAHSYPAANQVRFDFSLASAEANGMDIFEFGLLTSNGTLYARRVRQSSLAKTVDISIVGSWIITFN
jgi:hypothetical protein